jgi:hypothetical protein
MKKYLLTIFLCGIIILSAGCGSEKTYKTNQGTVKVNDNKVEVTTNDGTKSQVTTSENGQVSLPAGYPEDIVPIIDGGKIVLANKNEDADKKVSFWITVESDKEAGEVLKFYQEALKDASQIQNTQVNNDYFVSGVKGSNNFTVTVAANAEDNKKCNVQIFIGPGE